LAVNTYTLTTTQNSFSRSANTTPYIANTIVSGGSVLAVPIPDRPFFLRRLQINFSAFNAGTNPTIRTHFFLTDPTGGSFVANDAGTPNFAGLFASYEGFVDTQVLASNGIGSGDGANTLSLVYPTTADGVLYCLLETRTAFTPTSAAIVRVKIYTEAAN
jgi:hypothetical protein